MAIGTLLAIPAVSNAQTTHRVELDGINFIPADITIDVGDTVHWVWVSGIHNVESGVVENGVGVHDGNFRSGDPGFGLTYDLTFDQAFLDANPMLQKRYPYYCLVHTSVGMTGSVTVIIRGDINRDGEVNLLDHVMLIDCLAGPDGVPDATDCPTQQLEASDLDGDGDADLEDFSAVQLAFTS